MIRTKKPFEKAFIFRAGARDMELLRSAAQKSEMSQSEFVRWALRKAARRALRKENQMGELGGPQAA